MKIQDIRRERAVSLLARMPLAFVPNKGQANERVKFSVSRPGAAFSFTPDGVLISLSRPAAGPRAVGVSAERNLETLVFSQRLLGSNPQVEIVGKDQLPGKVNILRGKDAARWQTGIPIYGQIAYRGLYPGIDLVFKQTDGGELEYDLRLQAGVDPAAIKLAYRGADSLAVDKDGNLVIRTAWGEMKETKPAIYQEIKGDRIEVAGGFALLEGKEGEPAYGFRVGDFDPTYPLVIDPILAYSTHLGGDVRADGFTGTKTGTFGIAIDPANNAYVTGYTFFQDLTQLSTVVGDRDAFVAKFNPANEGADSLVYLTYIGGSSDDGGADLRVDDDGNAYVTGYTRSIDFPTTPGVVQEVLRGGTDAFIYKLNPAGDALVFSTFLGGSGEDTPSGIAIEPGSGNLWLGVAGTTEGVYDGVVSYSNDFPTSATAIQPTYGGGFADAFVSALNADGASFLHSTYLGGSAEDRGGQLRASSTVSATSLSSAPRSRRTFPSPPTPTSSTKRAGTLTLSTSELIPMARAA